MCHVYSSYINCSIKNSEVVAGDDKAEIEAKTQTLADLSGKLAARAHQASRNGGPPPAGEGSSADGADAGAGTNTGADDVVDAEFEEVRDDRR